MLVLAAALTLAGCGWAEWPPKSGIFAPGANPPPRTAEVANMRSAPRPPGVVARKGDTVYSLARHHQVSVRGLIEANNLRPPYTLYPGRRLVLPGGRTHKVKRGDSLYAISREYGVDVYALARTNGLESPYTLRVGQTLRLPDGLPPPPTATQTTKGPEGPINPPLSAAMAPPPPVAVPQPPEQTGKGFIWPVRGEVLSAFGPKSKGLHNDGINIAAPRGAPVRAVENGVVAYAGNELRGFGNLLLIRHADGWVTAYAHNRELLVKRGAKVTKGQIISRVGSSGSVNVPQLHFELRRGKRAVDPKRYLRS
ncbi:MAG: M23 family metallopeptidase [Rhodospirillales bacterium]|nr:M23 family metallopeptidase [Rhodospirillales bacterium]